MGIEVYIADEAEGTHAHVHDVLASKQGEQAYAVMSESPFRLLGQFTASSRASAGTTTITSPPVDGSLIVTDLTVSSERSNASSVTVQFNDGTRAIPLYVGNPTDAPINIHIPYNGRVRGWANARLELVTVGGVDANVTLVYVKTTDGLPFTVWDEAR